MIDIIIPLYNEQQFLESHEEYFRILGRQADIIFVDGGSLDDTAKVAARYGRVVRSSKGRAVQKNYGAKISQKEYVLFLHADVRVDTGAIEAAMKALKSGIIAGCFQMQIRDCALIFRIFEWLINARAKIWGVTDGDLGLFIRKDFFQKIGGFPETAIMEDILIGRVIRKQARLNVLPDKIQASVRKWHEKGFWFLFKKYAKIYWDFYQGKIRPQTCKV